mmetsp:Transcript_26370/g.39952  ORF Transcript_26370/g.39952 Transcript_26370/m.39952 type:complete len:575 (-) Transcript_26370:162-1886(-)
MHRILNRGIPGKYACCVLGAHLLPQSHITHAEASNRKQSNSVEKGNSHFDITDGWKRTSKDGLDFLKGVILTNNNKTDDDDNKGIVQEKSAGKMDTSRDSLEEFIKSRLFGGSKDFDDVQPEETKSSELDLYSMAWNFAKLVTGDRETQEKAVRDLIVKAQETNETGDGESMFTIEDITEVLKTVAKSLEKSFGTLDISRLFPSSLFYYFEREDEVKNPSWKRRMHRFHSGIDVSQISLLYELLYLANLSYADNVEEILKGCQNAKQPLELVYCDIKGDAKKPGHFVALSKDQSIWSSELRVVIVVRGTKTLADVMTDCIVDAVPYRGGKAHSGILESGLYLFNKHKNLLKNLKDLAKKRKIRLTLVGHSLGAGSATIAGLEFNDLNYIQAEVVGFGCPSLLSPDLSEQVKDVVTTVIADNDMVPRMSAASVTNVLLDIMEHDWTQYARRDMLQALNEVVEIFPSLKSDIENGRVTRSLDYMLENYVKPTIKEKTCERVKPELSPPGSCVHLYRDGSGISASIAPATFFQEIDVDRRMIDDHLIPGGYSQIFQDMMRQLNRGKSKGIEDIETFF